MLTLHVAGKIVYAETFNPVIRIPKPPPLCWDKLEDILPIHYIDYDEYEFIGKDQNGEYHYQLKEPNHGFCKGNHELVR